MIPTINKFEQQLEKWNSGILRGAQAKLAKCLHVSTATVALWSTGKRHPSKGYLTHMARLFGLDMYQTARLFSAPAAQTLAPVSFPVRSLKLRDVDPARPYTPLSTAGTLVSLPLFTHLPVSYPDYEPDAVFAWWTVPAQFAKQADFLVVLPTENDPDRVLFIQSSARWKNGRLMLARRGDTLLLVRVRHTAGKTVLQVPEGPTLTATRTLRPLGWVVRQLIEP